MDATGTRFPFHYLGAHRGHLLAQRLSWAHILEKKQGQKAITEHLLGDRPSAGWVSLNPSVNGKRWAFSPTLYTLGNRLRERKCPARGHTAGECQCRNEPRSP